MWLRLTGSEPELVEIDVHGDPAGRAVVDLLVRSGLVTRSGGGQLRIARTRTALDVDQPISELGLRNGDVLTASAPPPQPVSGTELVVGIGPSAGVCQVLAGTVTAGREGQLRVDDPGLSREHVRFTEDGDDVLAEDLGSLNGTHLFGRPLTEPTPVPADAPVEAASTVLRHHPRQPPPVPHLPVVRGVARFRRPARPPVPAPPPPHLVSAPPGPRPGLLPWSRAARDHRFREKAFRSTLEAARRGLERDLAAEGVRRWAAAPDLADVLRRTEGPAPDLWERRPGDGDWLQVRVGWTDLPSQAGYRLADGGDPQQREDAVRSLEPYAVARCAPLTVRLPDVGALGVAGAREQVLALARWLSLQLAALHSPADLRMAAALGSRTGWAWFAALPHAGSDDGPMLATGPDDARRLLTSLVTERARDRDARPAGEPAVVLLVDEDLPLPRETVEPLLRHGPSVDVHVVWLGRRRGGLPEACRAVVSVAPPGCAVSWADTGTTVTDASLDVVPPGPLETAAWNLAGLDDADRTGEDRAPASEPGARLLGMGDPTPEEVLRGREREPEQPAGTVEPIPVGSTVGGYLLKRQLGAGGMGAVYLARHRSLPRDVALKVLHPGFAGHRQFRERFERESDVLCRLDHPNVVDVVDRGQDGDLLWMSMRYIAGPDLDTALRERGPFPPEAAVAVVTDVGRALDAAHEAGLLHRDVKPANVLLRRHADGTEQAMLTDFGIAKDLAAAVSLTGAGEAPLTLAYAAPEQLEGLPLDRRADVYSLGAVLFEALTGRRAFPAADMAPLLASVMAGPVPDVRTLRPDTPAALAEVVTRALQKDREARFASCLELVVAAQAALVPPGPAPRTVIGRPEVPPPPGASPGGG